MKLVRLLFLFLLPPALCHGAATWLTDATKAQAQAGAANKAVLLDFTGSDWCGWCIRLQREVFSKPEFEEYANKNLVLVEVDFPQRKAQSEAQRRANMALAQRYNIEGYPTLVVLDSNGRELGRLGYESGGPKPFIGKLAKYTGKAAPTTPAPVAAMRKAENAIRDAVAKRGDPGADSPAQPSAKPVTNAGAAAATPQFDDLVLKGISGTKQKRLAMINNQTLVAGETASLRVSGKSMQVRCEEIKDQSVIVSWNAGKERRELKFRP